MKGLTTTSQGLHGSSKSQAALRPALKWTGLLEAGCESRAQNQDQDDYAATHWPSCPRTAPALGPSSLRTPPPHPRTASASAHCSRLPTPRCHLPFARRRCARARAFHTSQRRAHTHLSRRRQPLARRARARCCWPLAPVTSVGSELERSGLATTTTTRHHAKWARRAGHLTTTTSAPPTAPGERHAARAPRCGGSATRPAPWPQRRPASAPCRQQPPTCAWGDAPRGRRGVRGGKLGVSPSQRLRGRAV